MVFHLIERIFGNNSDPKSILQDQKIKYYLEEGFNQQEAEQLSWIQKSTTKGSFYGFIGGLGSLFFLNPHLNKLVLEHPRLHYRPNFTLLLKGSYVLFCVFIGDYMSNSKRQAANFWIQNYFSNNTFTKSKEAFLQNFSVLNRQFTQQEVQQFIDNQVRERDGQRRWIYNPNIHTNQTEEEFRKNMDLYFKKNIHPTERQDVKSQIQKQNKEKIQQGVQVELKAYKITNDVDSTGIMHNVAQAPFNKYGVFQKIN